jgi:hypothetical protein
MKSRFSRSARTAAAPASATAPTVEPFYDCRLTTWEAYAIIPAIALSMAMQCAPVLHSPLALPLIALLAMLCWLSPFTGFFFIACAQSLPYPEGAAFNPAQIGALTWLPVALVRYRRINLRGLTALWIFIPFLLWFAVLKWENVFHPRSEYFKAVIYAVIACQLLNEAKGRYLKCFLGLCIGALMVTNAYWGAMFGLPIELSTWGGYREGFARLGGARADSIMVWPPTLMGTYGIVGIAFAMAVRNIPRQTTVFLRLSAFLFLYSIPPLIATMSNAAYLGWSLMGLWLVGLLLHLKHRKLLPSHVRRGMVAILFTLILLVGIVYILDVLQVRSRMEALKKNYDEQRRTEGVAASRTGVWYYSFKTITAHPFSGRAFATEPEEGPPGYPQGYFSHNVFLDYGRHAGIPGMILLAWFFFAPFSRLWKRRLFTRYMGFYLAYFAMFLFWMVLSFQFYKTFWALWMLMMMAAKYDRPNTTVAAKASTR